MVSSTGTFVSCKDYDDDIDNLQEQINKLATKEDMTSQIATLQAALTTAAKDASDALAKASVRLPARAGNRRNAGSPIQRCFSESVSSSCPSRAGAPHSRREGDGDLSLPAVRPADFVGAGFHQGPYACSLLEKRESALSLGEAGSLLCLPESRSVHRRRVRNR